MIPHSDEVTNHQQQRDLQRGFYLVSFGFGSNGSSSSSGSSTPRPFAAFTSLFGGTTRPFTSNRPNTLNPFLAALLGIGGTTTTGGSGGSSTGGGFFGGRPFTSITFNFFY
jgi:hypothetical protein